MKFNQNYLYQTFKEYLKNDKKVIIFATEKEQFYLEKALLSLSESHAFFHVQVVSPQRYGYDLLKKNGLFNYRPLSKTTALLACKKALEMDTLDYFKGLEIDGRLLETFIQTFEKMADIDLDKEVCFEGLSQYKWDELKRMYQCFHKEKGSELMEAELYQLVLPYIEEDVLYVDFTHRMYSLSYARFLETASATSLDDLHLLPESELEIALEKNYHQSKVEAIENLPMELFEVQLFRQEEQLILNRINHALLEGAKYSDMIVYFSNMDDLTSFVRKCPYPCRYEANDVNQKDLAFVKHLINYLKELETNENVLLLSGLDEIAFENWLADFNNGDTKTRLRLINERLSVPMFSYERDLSLDELVLCLPLLIQSQHTMLLDGVDRIELTTYQSPILAKHFQYAFLSGLNEDAFPSKIADGGLVLNDELQAYYGSKTPLDRQNEKEWDIFRNILGTANYYVASCHFEELSGTPCLPSLLFNHLKDLKGVKKASNYPFDFPKLEEDLLLDDFERRQGQPEPLDKDIAKKIYHKENELKISPSELENFNQCPFRHFLSYGLKIYPSKPQLETRARFGTLMHDMLDYASSLFGHDFESRLEKLETNHDGTLDERLARLVDEYLTSHDFKVNDIEETYLLQTFKEQFLNVLKVLLFHVQEGQFELAYHELDVSEQKDDVTYFGRIDRADVYKNYLKVIDYKSSNKSLDLGLAMQGFNVQMLIYLDLLSKKYQLDKGAVLYFNTSPRKIDANGRINLDGTSGDDYIKTYQMEGYLLNEEMHDVMYGVDQNFPESKICHIRYVKSRDEYTGALLEKEQWDHLLENIFKHLHQIVDTCFNEGDIRIYPAGSKESAMKMKVSPCRFCDYQNICLKDPFYHEEREIQAYTKEQVKILLEGGQLNESSDINE